MGEVPVRTVALVADGANLLAVNLTPAFDYRDDLKNQFNPDDPRAKALRFSLERQDALTPFDPKNRGVRQAFRFAAGSTINAIARGLSLDQIADPSGRRLRDNWSIGSDVLDERLTARMRAVIVKEVPGTVDTRGDGLGCVVRDIDVGQGEALCATSEVP